LAAETLPASGSANIVTDLAGIRLAVRLDFYDTYERNGSNWMTRIENVDVDLKMGTVISCNNYS
jgi:hypothetical protein